MNYQNLFTKNRLMVGGIGIVLIAGLAAVFLSPSSQYEPRLEKTPDITILNFSSRIGCGLENFNQANVTLKRSKGTTITINGIIETELTANPKYSVTTLRSERTLFLLLTTKHPLGAAYNQSSCTPEGVDFNLNTAERYGFIGRYNTTFHLPADTPIRTIRLFHDGTPVTAINLTQDN